MDEWNFCPLYYFSLQISLKGTATLKASESEMQALINQAICHKLNQKKDANQESCSNQNSDISKPMEAAILNINVFN